MTKESTVAIRVDDQNIPDMPEDFDGTEAEWVEQYSSEEGLQTSNQKSKPEADAQIKELEGRAWGEEEGTTEDLDEVVLWAKIQYEEGTSGPLKNIEGVMVDDDYGVTVINPEEGIATTIGDRFIVRVDVQQLVMDDEDEAHKDQADTSADRFRA